MNELVIVLDFGDMRAELVARRVRDSGVFCEVAPYNAPYEELAARAPKGFILTGSPRCVLEPDSPRCDPRVFSYGAPVLGICYGAQLVAHVMGGTVVTDDRKMELGVVGMNVIDGGGALLNGVAAAAVSAASSGAVSISAASSSAVSTDAASYTAGAASPVSLTCWMSHDDSVELLPSGFTATASTDSCPNAAFEDRSRGLYCVQYHPEVSYSMSDKLVFDNFLHGICGCSGDWDMKGFVDNAVDAIRLRVGEDGRALCAFSGGVDSTVAAALVSRAIGKRLTCIFVDHGLLRQGEADAVEAMCRTQLDMEFIRVDASKRFLDRLSGITEPEEKRRIVGEEFIRVFEDEARALGGGIEYFVQGTIYPDVVESGVGTSAAVKSHHNVGGLPERIGFKEILEPLRLLFKEEVRRAGLELGIPIEVVARQPFPGPGLAVRCMGEVTEEKLAILREADAIFREEMATTGWDKNASQYFAVLTNARSVGVQDDARSYDYAVSLRAVKTDDFMTAEIVRLPYDMLERVASRIIAETPRVNRVVYDITSKPPATIEWE